LETEINRLPLLCREWGGGRKVAGRGGREGVRLSSKTKMYRKKKGN